MAKILIVCCVLYSAALYPAATALAAAHARAKQACDKRTAELVNQVAVLQKKYAANNHRCAVEATPKLLHVNVKAVENHFTEYGTTAWVGDASFYLPLFGTKRVGLIFVHVSPQFANLGSHTAGEEQRKFLLETAHKLIAELGYDASRAQIP
ncbi:MAG TPA: hypothetical protein VLG71_02855 [Candidatus Limnocylindria bacterium]|nr:hypothetical protein [Candidatus Limnocylindria bacterium]